FGTFPSRASLRRLLHSLEITLVRVSCISMGFWIGWSTWSRSVAARPSQKNADFQARLKSDMALRVPAWPSAPRLKARFLSAPAAARSWHEAQDWLLSAERRFSLNNRRPNWTPSSVSGLSSGSDGRGKKADMVRRYGLAVGAISRWLATPAGALAGMSRARPFTAKAVSI